MNSKERVCTAIAHRQPDRVPIDFYARDEVTAALQSRLGPRSHEALLDALGVDLRGVGPAFRQPAHRLCYADPTVRVEGDLHFDIWGVGFRPNTTSAGFYMDLAYSPLKSLQSAEELDAYPWPAADLWDYSGIAAQACAASDYWVWAHSRGIFEISWFMRGFDEFLTDLALNPDLANALMDRVQDYLTERTSRVLEAAPGLIDMVEYNDDVGGQNGLLISPGMWREFLKPRMAAFIRLCRQHGVKIRYHSCGGIRPIIPDLIEIGVDVLNPVQTFAAGMEPEALKRDFGHVITFNGAIDTQTLLPFASRDVVAKETRRLIDLLGRNGGFILAPSHVFQPDVPLDNIIAVYEAALGGKLIGT